MTAPTTFLISLSIESYLTVEELWPDGDAPEHPTVEDVHRVIKECGGVRRVIEDWNLIDSRDRFDITEWPPAGSMERFAAARAKLAANAPPAGDDPPTVLTETKRGPAIE